MDLDGYVAIHQPEWDRLRHLISRRRRLSGAEADELVTLYQRVATHMSVVRSASSDAALLVRLSTLVADARAAVTGAHAPVWRDVGTFFAVTFPAAVYRAARWWVPTAVASLLASLLLGWWLVAHPEVHSAVAPPAVVRQLVRHDFAHYYSAEPAGQFAFGIWANNAWVAAGCLVLGVLLCVPVVWILWQNVVNVGLSGGFMVAYGRGEVFFGLITPHGLLELTAVFIAAGAGLRLGWTVIAPGRRTRSDALARTGRTTVGMALGLAIVLVVSGVIEAFVTPSDLPTWARIGIGVVAEVAFLTYVVVLGARASRGGETGDISAADRGAELPTTG